jgi:hypothetical protein
VAIKYGSEWWLVLKEFVSGNILEGVGVNFPTSSTLRLVMALMFVFCMIGGIGEGILREARVLREAFLDYTQLLKRTPLLRSV